MKYYVLIVSLQSKDTVLRDKYNESILKHNKKSIQYFNGNTDVCDSGFDLFVPEELTISNKTHSNKIDHKIVCNMLYIDTNRDTSLQELIPSSNEYVRCGYYLYPRSSTGSKTPLRLANSVGIIDPSYCGNIISVFDNYSSETYEVEKYQRLVQICCPNMSYPLFVLYSDEMIQNNTERSKRGSGGFGSTGK